MNFIIFILLLFACIGMIDKLIGNRWGLALAFENGLSTMGGLCFSMIGIYCGAVTLTQSNEKFLSMISLLPWDISLFVGAILAPDLGGYPIAIGIAQTSGMGHFSGILVSSMLGCLISFVLPISLGVLPEQEHRGFLEGIVWGIIALPIGLIPGGFILGMTGTEIIKGMIPIVLICIILILGLKHAPSGTIGVMTMLGKLVNGIGTILFVIVVWGLFLPTKAIFSQTLVGEAMMIVVKITIVVCGSLVMSTLFMKYGKKMFQALSCKLGVNEQSIMGLLISFATSISMLGMYQDMDEKGKRMNAAFSVGGAFCLGGQLAYIAAVSDTRGICAYLVCKMFCGLSAVFFVKRFNGRPNYKKARKYIEKI